MAFFTVMVFIRVLVWVSITRILSSRGGIDKYLALFIYHLFDVVRIGMNAPNICNRFGMNDIDLLDKSTSDIGFLFIDKVDVWYCVKFGDAFYNFEIFGIDDVDLTRVIDDEICEIFMGSHRLGYII